ncbi:mitochondrial fission 1 protein-like isoform X2 [Orbicella faveolata]|uniref:mitochondrial fission 1 protein-like isoform X2 n=1 Tax=Orbicella faveolata TaxID=48498 RepID=UPI0009E45769|nr:mitochondrial fission 1 protein-like isoform X2 [Orbicella faveolata]
MDEILSKEDLKEYKSAIKYTNRLLQIEPQNRQGIELQEKITTKMKKDGLIGLGILGGTALIVGGAAALVGLAFASRK